LAAEHPVFLPVTLDILQLLRRFEVLVTSYRFRLSPTEALSKGSAAQARTPQTHIKLEKRHRYRRRRKPPASHLTVLKIRIPDASVLVIGMFIEIITQISGFQWPESRPSPNPNVDARVISVFRAERPH